ncbi:MAG: dCTP deaminase [Candidatus Thermoplasmatota archaeon]|nr:dCTP deaminase [Candidatus Thermoplasmatota archaeon]
MIVSDSQIEDLIEKGELTIKNYSEENLTPNGYDLTIEEVVVEERKPQSEGNAVIPEGTWFAVSTKEYVEFPSNIAGEIWIRTTWARQGVISSFGMIDAGFEGNLTLSAFNSYQEIEIPIGETFAQLVFHLLSEESEKKYSDRSGNYQGQEGVTLD